MAPVPRITTRGYYDRSTGMTLRRRRYSLFPRGLDRMLAGSAEIVIMVHGMRNDSAGAAAKTQIAAQRLADLGYEHTIIGYSYDSNIAGAHIRHNYPGVLATAGIVARKNGYNLASFVEDFERLSPGTAVRLMGHSLGSEVILSALQRLYRGGMRDSIEAVYFFAASVTRQDRENNPPGGWFPEEAMSREQALYAATMAGAGGAMDDFIVGRTGVCYGNLRHARRQRGPAGWKS